MGALTIKDFEKDLVRLSPEIEKVLPNPETVTRMTRILLTEVKGNPKLLKCDRQSLYGAMMRICQLGLEAGFTGQAYLIPYGETCQVIVGYKGMLSLIHKSGNFKKVESRNVYANDFFEIIYGAQSTIIHKPCLSGDRGNFMGSYTIVFFQDNDIQFEYMSKYEIDAIKKSTDAWKNNYSEMAKKTVIRRLFKYLDTSPSLQEAIALDETGESGTQDHSMYAPSFVHTIPKKTREAQMIESLNKTMETEEEQHA